MSTNSNVAPLRIALLGYRGNPYSGGQGVYLKYLSRALAQAGHTVTVIGGPPYAQLDANIELVKLPSLDLYAQPNHVTALRPRHLRSWADTFEWASMLTGGFPEPYTFGRRLLHWLNRHKQRFDLVHDNQSLASALLSLQQCGTPIVATIHHPITTDRDIALAHAKDTSERLLIRRWHHFLKMQIRVARKLRHIVTVSHSSKRDICGAFGIDPERVRVVHNGIDTEEFCPEPEVPRESMRLISTASADQPLKGTAHLIRAFAKLREHHSALQLTIIGRLKAGGVTERLIAATGTGAAIEFCHDLSTAQIRNLYAKATIAVVPSEYEGFGLPAGEAMACGTPLVSTDGGALPEVVGDAGIVVPARDADALARAIGELLVDAPRRARLAKAGRERIEQQFSWATAAHHIGQIYSEAIAHGFAPRIARTKADA